MQLLFIQPCIIFGCVHIHYFGKWEGVGPWKFESFLGPVNWYRADAIGKYQFGAQKTQDARMQNIMHGAL